MTEDEAARDYAGEMHELVSHALEAPSVVVPLLAHDLVEKLEANDPDLLRGWLMAKAPGLLSEYIGGLLRSRRSHARATAKRGIFANDAARHESGDSEALAGWLTTKYFVGPEQKNLGDFTREDLKTASAEYSERSRTNAFEAHFLTALAKKVTGSKKVSDVYTEEQITRMRSSFDAG